MKQQAENTETCKNCPYWETAVSGGRVGGGGGLFYSSCFPFFSFLPHLGLSEEMLQIPKKSKKLDFTQ